MLCRAGRDEPTARFLDPRAIECWTAVHASEFSSCSRERDNLPPNSHPLSKTPALSLSAVEPVSQSLQPRQRATSLAKLLDTVSTNFLLPSAAPTQPGSAQTVPPSTDQSCFAVHLELGHRLQPSSLALATVLGSCVRCEAQAHRLISFCAGPPFAFSTPARTRFEHATCVACRIGLVWTERADSCPSPDVEKQVLLRSLFDLCLHGCLPGSSTFHLELPSPLGTHPKTFRQTWPRLQENL